MPNHPISKAPHRRSALRFALCCFLFALCGLALILAAAPRPATEAVNPSDKPEPYIRVAREKGEDGQSPTIAMEIAVRRLAPKEGGPMVWLVGAVHVGDAKYYAALQEFLDAQPLVLYEGVGRPPFMETGEADDTQRLARTESALDFTASRIEWYRGQFHAPPRSLAMLGQAVKEHRKTEAKFLRHSTMDGWSRPFKYERAAAGYTLTSLGSDGKPGGEDHAADITRQSPDEIDPEWTRPEPPNIQQSLAAALGLVFQLEGIDYDREHFVNSDMSMQQIQGSVSGSGGGDEELETLMSAMDGSGFLGGLLRFGLKIIEVNPRVRGMVRAVMIEVLGESKGDLSNMGGVTEGQKKLLTVLIDQRNQIVADDLSRVLKSKDAPTSIAVFYGAGHLLDLEKRLADQLGYKPAEQFWLRAFSVNLKEAGLTEADLAGFRAMVQAQVNPPKGK